MGQANVNCSVFVRSAAAPLTVYLNQPMSRVQIVFGSYWMATQFASLAGVLWRVLSGWFDIP